MLKKIFVLALFAAGAFHAQGQGKFGYEDIRKGKFRPKGVSGLRSMADGEHYTVNSSGVILRYSYGTGQLVDTVCNTNGLELVDGRVADYTFSADEGKIMFRFDSRPLYRRSSYSRFVIFDRATGEERLLTQRDSIRYAVFSPAGDKVAFVYGNNIYLSDLSSGTELRITDDGKFNYIINGMPDWVYEEEFGLNNLLRWSPDGERIAYLRSDESRVKEFTMMYYNRPDEREERQAEEGNPAAPLYTRPYSFKYPKAGEENSVVELYIHDLRTGERVKVDTGVETDQYVPFFEWTPGGRLYFFRLNRLQNHLEIILAGDDGRGRVIYEEKSPQYIEDLGLAGIKFLSDSKRFVIMNETRTGYRHIYMYHIDKGYRYAVTSGAWEVTELIEATDDRIWFLSNETSPLRNNLYSANIRGKQKKRLTVGEGTYRISASAGCRYYMSTFSNASTPNIVTLHRGDGTPIRTLEDNAALAATIEEVALPVREFATFGVDADGPGGESMELNYYIVKPGDFDPGKRYPVLVTQYSGPGSQQVTDRFAVGWEDVMVQHGYIVACCDPRGTGGRGEQFRKLTYGRLGEAETADQIAFARHLGSLPFVDESRIGIYGWSYGGFMALNCILRGADVFKMAIAVAPVTSWRFYNTIYTERFNGLPEGNGYGYDEVSPLIHADKLEGALLMVHGSGDDNVHAQNSYRMAQEFVRAGKQFDMMIYPDDNHSMVPDGRTHIYHKMINYCLREL